MWLCMLPISEVATMVKLRLQLSGERCWNVKRLWFCVGGGGGGGGGAGVQQEKAANEEERGAWGSWGKCRRNWRGRKSETHRRSARPARPAWPCRPCPPCRPSWRWWSSSSAAPRATTATAAPPAPQVDDRMLGHVTGSGLNDWPVGMPGFPCYWSEAGSRQVVRDAGCSSASLATLRKHTEFGLGDKSPYIWSRIRNKRRRCNLEKLQ